MNVVFVSNFMNQHQSPIADELYVLLGRDYHFVATQPMPEYFAQAGYPDYSLRPYLIKAYEGDLLYQKAKTIINEADIAVFGSNMIPEFWESRLHTGKVTFDYQERLIRSIKTYFKLPWYYLNGSILRNYLPRRGKPLYLLCSGAYTAADCLLFNRRYSGRYKWGYITGAEEFDLEEKLSKNNLHQCLQIIWCGRFLDLKRPILIIKMAAELKKKGYRFCVNMYGSPDASEPGSENCYLKCVDLIKKEKLEDQVVLLGNRPNKEILQAMRDNDLYILSSDRHEGWGATLNEAMSQGCAVVASSAPGSVPYLLGNNEYGLVFHHGSLSQLVKEVEYFLQNPHERQEYARKAYRRLHGEWGPRHAAGNLLELFRQVLSGEKHSGIPEDQPCSMAEYRFFKSLYC